MKKIKMKYRKKKIDFGKKGVTVKNISDYTMREAKEQGESVYKVWKHLHLRKEYPSQKPKNYFHL